MKQKYTRHEDKKKELLKDPEIRKAYKAELSILKMKPLKEAHYTLADYKKELFKDPKARARCEKAFTKIKLAHQNVKLREKTHKGKTNRRPG